MEPVERGALLNDEESMHNSNTPDFQANRFILIDMVHYLTRLKEHQLKLDPAAVPSEEATRLIDLLHSLEHEPDNSAVWADIAVSALGVILGTEEEPADCAVRLVGVLAKRERALRLSRHGASCESTGI
jgi:hypothetical protein